MSEPTWVKRWKMDIASKSSLPGVYRRKQGGFVVRGRALNPKTGRMIEVLRALPEPRDAREALAWLHDAQRRVREGGLRQPRELPRFSSYAVSLMDRKIAVGDIKSAAGREKWGHALRHLIDGTKAVTGFGDYFIDRIRHADVIEWRTGIGKLVTSKVYTPTYANDWLAIMRVVMKAAVAEFELERDPMLGIQNFDKSLHRTYTVESPNSLLAREARTFMQVLMQRWPQHFAFVALGLALGQRPSTLRPLRRKGSTPDYMPKQGVLLVRRSHTRGAEVMDVTKTKRDQHIELPREMVEILDWHIKTQLTNSAMKDADLLFPAEDGGFRSPSSLRKAFDDVRKQMKVTKRITPRALRRTFQDLTRAAHVDGVVAKAISGHATDAMRAHYSTASGSEVRAGIAKVISLAGFREARRPKKPGRKAAS